MIDTFSLALSHGLMLIVAWRLLRRADLNQEARAGSSEQPPGA